MRNINSYLPWHESIWEVLKKREEQDKLPHALLFTGVSGVGKRIFAEHFFKSLLCINPNNEGLACGKCYSCEWMKANTHPDFLEITQESENKNIKIDQIRNLIDFNHKTTSLDKFKIMIIYDAHLLNVYAANALLKTLEEPAPKTLIMLITENLMMLSETIRSRCQIINFTVPSKEIALSWLKNISQISDKDIETLLSLSNGAPLKALEFLESNEMEFRKKLFEKWINFIRNKNIKFAEELVKEDLNRVFMHLKSWIVDVISFNQVSEEKYIKNMDFVNDLVRIGEEKSNHELYDFLSELNQCHYALKKSSNLNMQLMVESLLLSWLGVKDEIS